MFKYKYKCLFPKDINPEKDVFLGETSVQIRSFDGKYPSVHLVKSYMLHDANVKDREEGCFYHIFEYKCGTSAINYNYNQFEQVKKYIDLSPQWNIFYKDTDDEHGLIPIPKENIFRELN
ncbi:hypothetical protein [Anoxybacillus kestanbolensis]|uniref:hypothetical protein n=1 Tax=Anoxybacillus kestanbolensis TaxID=227476 RepID=UPI003D1A12E9